MRNYERGFKRIYAVVAFCWVAFCIAGAIAIANSEARDRESGILAFAAIAIVVPILGYVFFFRVVPWIVKGFR